MSSNLETEMSETKLTGEKRFRVNRKMELVLQVQSSRIASKSLVGLGVSWENFWRDAVVEDLKIDLNTLNVKG